jgi:hypothetical protein
VVKVWKLPEWPAPVGRWTPADSMNNWKITVNRQAKQSGKGKLAMKAFVFPW